MSHCGQGINEIGSVSFHRVLRLCLTMVTRPDACWK
jgi:hypothetical protein